jgi:ABC-type molybdate transport system substrate-binding protein
VRKRLIAGAILLMASLSTASAQQPVLLHAAGSLRAALTEVANAFSDETGVPVRAIFGASGLLRERIEKGEPAEVFASADRGHPEALARAGRAGPVTGFARNGLCAFTRPEVAATTETLLAKMLDPATKLGTSTPKADPSGDYAWQLFDKAEALRPGAKAALEAKALQLTGGPTSPRGPEGRNLYGHVLASRQADIFLAYCTNAGPIAQEEPSLKLVALPPALVVGAEYGLTLVDGASPNAGRLAMFIASPAGQAILGRHGFATP